MTRRQCLAPAAAALLAASLLVLPACGRKPAGGDPALPPVAATSPHALFVHLKAKAVTSGELFGAVREAFAKAGGAAEWAVLEREVRQVANVAPTELESLTFCIATVPVGGPRWLAIVKTTVPVDKDRAFDSDPEEDFEFLREAKSPPRGFRQVRDYWVHFPEADGKTVVILHPELAAKYTAGFVKDRTGWPLTPALIRAAESHTLYAVMRPELFPVDLAAEVGGDKLRPLLAAKSITLTVDLKGRELDVAARAAFADATAAETGKAVLRDFLRAMAGEVERTAARQPMKAARDELVRLLSGAKIDVAGSDVTLTTRYAATVDQAEFAKDAVSAIRAAEGRLESTRQMQQVVLGLHNAESAHGVFPIHGVAAKGMPLRTASEKPLLSWRVAILPDMGHEALYKQFRLDEPWDSEHNKTLIEKMPAIYAPVGRVSPAGHTHLQMVVGPRFSRPGMGMADVTDGSSKTVLVAEAAEPVIWTKPADILLTEAELPKGLMKKFGGWQTGGFTVGMYDGSVRFVRDSVGESALAAALTPNGREPLRDDWSR